MLRRGERHQGAESRLSLRPTAEKGATTTLTFDRVQFRDFWAQIGIRWRSDPLNNAVRTAVNGWWNDEISSAAPFKVFII